MLRTVLRTWIIASALMAATLGVGIQAAAATTAVGGTFDYQGVTYQVVTATTVQVGDGSDTAVPWSTGAVSIPAHVGDGDGTSYTVTSIAANAFYRCVWMSTATMPDTIASIGNDAFYLCALTSVNIPDSVISIGDEAFALNYPLGTVRIGSSVKTIGASAFEACQALGSIDIPDKVETIGAGAFAGCNSLDTATLGRGVTSIGSSAFQECTLLAHVNIPSGVTAIAERTFNVCGALTSITLPDSVKSIGDDAFGSCGALRSINIPQTTTSIGHRAFLGCPQLQSIAVPHSVVSLGDSAFELCSSLTTATIEASITALPPHLFYQCSSLKSVTLPQKLTSICMYAFNGCTSLPAIEIPASVTSIGDSAFYMCFALTSANIPNGVTWIDDLAFYECSALVLPPLPASVTHVGSQAFEEVRWSVAGASITGVAPSYPFLGGAITPMPTVTLAGRALQPGTDYTVAYRDNAKLGSASIVVTGVGTYASSAQRTFVISRPAIDEAVVSGIAASYPFTGGAIQPVPTVTLDGAALQPGVDYTVAYSQNVALGRATVTIAAIGLRTGTLMRTFQVVIRLGAAKKTLRRGHSTTLHVTGGYGSTTWRSANARIARVSRAGVVTGRRAGRTTIIATRNGCTMRCTIVVRQ